jgi:hypothetical protein
MRVYRTLGSGRKRHHRTCLRVVYRVKDFGPTKGSDVELGSVKTLEMCAITRHMSGMMQVDTGQDIPVLYGESYLRGVRKPMVRLWGGVIIGHICALTGNLRQQYTLLSIVTRIVHLSQIPDVPYHPPAPSTSYMLRPTLMPIPTHTLISPCLVRLRELQCGVRVLSKTIRNDARTTNDRVSRW